MYPNTGTPQYKIWETHGFYDVFDYFSETDDAGSANNTKNGNNTGTVVVTIFMITKLK